MAERIEEALKQISTEMPSIEGAINNLTVDIGLGDPADEEAKIDELEIKCGPKKT